MRSPPARAMLLSAPVALVAAPRSSPVRAASMAASAPGVSPTRWARGSEAKLIPAKAAMQDTLMPARPAAARLA
jgi:hypothetical protein